jgi:hypothetical protein
MAYTIKDFHRDYILEHLHLVPLDAVLARYTVNARLEGLTLAERLERLPIEERLADLTLTQILSRFSTEAIMDYLEERQADKNSEKFLNSVHSDSDNNPRG